MKTNSLLLIAVLIGALHAQAAPNEIIYQTGFEPPAFTADQPLPGQDGWLGGWFLPGTSHPTTISTVNARSGTQCVRFHGADAQGAIAGNAFAFRPLYDLNDPNPPPTPLIVEIRADVRLDGPQTGTLGTPEQDIISANLFAVIQQRDQDPVGLFDIGGFFVSSAGKIWAYNWVTGNARAIYGASVPYVMGTYHTLMLRVNFVSRTLTYFVDGVELGSAPFPAAIKSDQFLSGYLSMYGRTQVINTPELSYSRANYNAHFDNYSIESVPLTPNDVTIEFAATDYASEEKKDDAKITIIRRGYTDSAVSATFTTTDSSATPWDYKPTSTRVKFDPGETMKTVKMQTRDDRLCEADETINLLLSAASPGVLLWRPSATLWVLDDERAGSADTDFRFRVNPLGISYVSEVSSVALLPDDHQDEFFASVFGEDAAHNYVGVLARFDEDGSVDLKFEPYPLPYGTGPSQITVLDEGKRLLVNVVDRLVCLDSKGRPDSNFFSAIAAGDPAIDPTGYIVDVAVQPDGKIIIAGLFSTVNGVARKNIARVNSNGALDTSFDPGAGTDDYIADVALQPDGKILIAGYFQNIAGQPHPLLARLDSDGSVDSSFDTGAGFGDSLYGFPGLQTIAVQPDGRILAGGNFDSYQGVPHMQLVRLLPNGALDPSFDTGSGFESSFFPGAPGFVGRVVLQPDGQLLVTGGFGYFNGVRATGIIRLKQEGALDPTFRLGGADAIAADVNGGAAVVLLPDGDILVPLSDNISFLRNDPINYRGLVRLKGDSDCDDEARHDRADRRGDGHGQDD